MDDLTQSAPESLRAWMDELGVGPTAIARAVGKTAEAVYGWLEGKYRPEALVRAKLERFTNGRVPAWLWLTDGERAEIEHVQPFAATG